MPQPDLHVLQFATSSTWTGEMSHVLGITKALSRLGIRTTLAYRTRKRKEHLTLFEQAAAREEIGNLLPLDLDSGFYPLRFFRDWNTLRRFVLHEGVNVLHCHRSQEHWLSALLPSGSGLSIIRTRHVVTPVRPGPINRWLYGRTARVIATAHLIRNDFEQSRIVPKEKVTILHGGVDPERFIEAKGGEHVRQELGIPPETLLLGAIGHLDPVKGYRELIRACGTLRNRGIRFHLVIAGREGKQKPGELEALAKEAGIADRLHLTGFRTDIPDVIQALDVAIIPSNGSEGNSRTALELMAGAKPIVSTRVGCLPDLLEDGKTALLSTGTDADSLAEPLLHLVESPELRTSLAHNARKHVLAGYTWNEVAQQTVEIYRSAIEGQ